MDKTIPSAAAYLLLFIYDTETSKSPPACYEVIFGNRQTRVSKRITEMTIAEIQKAQATWKTKAWAKKFKSTKASSATGAPQFMEKTLEGLIAELKLNGSQIFNGDLQDRLAYHLLKRRGYEQFISGKITRTEFGKRLAMEWASFPVLARTLGSQRTVNRGQSYYAGDGLNNSLTSPDTVEMVLDKVMELSKEATKAPLDYAPPNPTTIVEDLPEGDPVSVKQGIFAGLLGVLIISFGWFISLPCNIFGIFCGG